MKVSICFQGGPRRIQKNQALSKSREQFTRQTTSTLHNGMHLRLRLRCCSQSIGSFEAGSCGWPNHILPSADITTLATGKAQQSGANATCLTSAQCPAYHVLCVFASEARPHGHCAPLRRASPLVERKMHSQTPEIIC